MKKNYTISVTVEKFWTIILPLAIIFIFAGGATGVFVVDRIIIPNLPGIANRGIVKVPNILNISHEEARQALYNVGLRLNVQSKEYNDTLPNSMIVSQQPSADQKVKKGRHVNVILSKGSETSTLPDLKNLTERMGKNKLREAGFANIRVNKIFSDKVPMEHVITTHPKKGTTISREIIVELSISKGPRPTHAQVPNVVGDLLSEAKQKIADSGLRLGKINYKISNTAKPGSVISQSISPGTNAPLESKINLVLSAKK